MYFEEKKEVKTCFNCKGSGIEMSEVIRFVSDMFIKDKVERDCCLCLGESYILVVDRDHVRRG